MRNIVVGGAQMGPIQKADTRVQVIERMIVLLDDAKANGCTLVVFPELALTTFFPRWYLEDQEEVDKYFENSMLARTPKHFLIALGNKELLFLSAMRN